MIIDTHAHLYWESFKEDLDDIIQKALGAGITSVINVGVDIKTSKEALRQAQRISGESQLDRDKLRRTITIYSSIGIHPHEAVKYFSDKAQVTSDKLHEDVKKLEEIYKQNPKKIIAVGECGLDYKEEDEETKALQRKLFQAQIDLAKKLNLPLLIHCRDDRSQNSENSECWDEVIEMTKDHFGVYHCYSGLLPTTNYLLQTTNFYVSFAGNLTYPKNEYLKEAVKVIPIDRVLVETDCPFLPPQKYRGQRNEPAYTIETLKIIADIKDTPLREVAAAIYQNTIQLFKLKI